MLDLTRVWAGPLCTRTLADFGADVVRIEAPWARGPRRVPEAAVVASQLFPGNDPGDTPWNRNAHEIKYAIGKRSVVLDLATDAGVDTLRRLVPSFDVVIENYSPRVMPDMGMDESEIHRLNPDAVYVTMPGYGRDGPARDWLAYGSSVDSHAGLSTLIGYPDQHPWKGGIAWPDPVAGLHAAAGLLAAVWDREADPGRGGVTLESAQFEATVAVVGDRLVEAQIDGEPGPQWNRDHEGRFVAQGIYPCAGVDRWVAASVPSDAWPALCRLVGLDPATADDHAAVDAAMAAWTAQLDHRDAEARLQAVGVAAGAVLDAPGVLADPQLAAADAFVTVDQPEVGPFLVPRTPIRLDGRVTSVAGPAPGLGQHHHDVLTADAGLTPTDIAALVEAGVVATEPPA